jgi:hypothetical protein
MDDGRSSGIGEGFFFEEGKINDDKGVSGMADFLVGFFGVLGAFFGIFFLDAFSDVDISFGIGGGS